MTVHSDSHNISTSAKALCSICVVAGGKVELEFLALARQVTVAQQATCPTCLQELVRRSGSTAEVDVRIADICCDDAGGLP